MSGPVVNMSVSGDGFPELFPFSALYWAGDDVSSWTTAYYIGQTLPIALTLPIGVTYFKCIIVEYVTRTQVPIFPAQLSLQSVPADYKVYWFNQPDVGVSQTVPLPIVFTSISFPPTDGFALQTIGYREGQIAILNYPPQPQIVTGIGASPSGMCFDGASIWVAGSGTLTQIARATGQVIGTFALAVGQATTAGLCFDSSSASVWVAGDTALVTQQPALDVTISPKSVVTQSPAKDVCFANARVWFSQPAINQIVAYNVSDSSTVAVQTAVGTSPTGLCSDQTFVYVVNSGDGTLTKIDAELGTVVTTAPIMMLQQSSPSSTIQSSVTVTYPRFEPILQTGDGRLWVLDLHLSNLVTMRTQDLDTLAVTPLIGMEGAIDMVFDGRAAIWIVNRMGQVAKVNICDYTVTVVFDLWLSTAQTATSIFYDGTDIWVSVTSSSSSSVQGTCVVRILT